TQDVTFTITGTNDAPVFAAEASGSAGLGDIVTTIPIAEDRTGIQDWGFSWRLANGGFVVAWADDPALGGNQFTPLGQGALDLQMRIFGPDGTPLTGDVTVNQSGSGYYPRMANLGDDKFVIIWHSNVGGSGIGPLNGRVYKNDGTPAGSEFAINGSTSWVNITETSTGFAVASHPNYTTLALQSFDFSGQPSGATFTITKSYGDWGHLPIGLSDGGHGLFFQANDGHLFFQKFTNSNIPVGASVRLDGAQSSRAGFNFIEATNLRPGVQVVSWLQTDTSGVTDLHAMLLNDSGVAIGLDIVVAHTASNGDLNPRITTLTSGGFAVSWNAANHGFVQLFNANGDKVGTTHQIAIGANVDFLSITPTVDGGAVASWSPNASTYLIGLDAVHIDSLGAIGERVVLVPHRSGLGYSLPYSAVWNDGSLGIVHIDRSLVSGLGVEQFITRVSVNSVSGNTLTEDTASTSGTLNFSDVDLNDVHSISGGSGVYTGTGTALGTLAASVTHDTTGTGTGGVVSWTYTLNTAAAQYLAAGVTKTETFDVVLSDGTTTVTKSITVTITGTNDGAAITANAGGDYAVTEAGGVGNAVAGDPSAQGQLTITDADSGQDHFQTPASLAGTYGTFTFNATTGAWTYALNQTLANALAAGANVADALTVTSFDGTATHNITVNITGGND
ncbi:MAG: VCBS domain-containing protein, partial [Hyphomicrobium sp.]